jgi:hypothetical protein
MRRNLILAIDDELLKKARKLGVRRNLSVPALLRQELLRLVAEDEAKDEAYEKAKRAALERLQRGSNLGGGPLPRRNELY